MTHNLLLITDDARPGGMVDHAHDPDHPERPERLIAIARALADLPASRVAREEPATPAQPRHLLRVHDAALVKHLLSKRGQLPVIDEDTTGNERTIDLALLAAGTGVRAVEALARRDADAVFAIVRPPGHHAERRRAMGFCYFNTIAVAAAHAVEALGFRRVLIVDWDVHHGNGTQDIFEHRADVLVFNIHERGNYPGTGHAHEIGQGPGQGFTINVPLAPASSDEDYLGVFHRVLEPAADQFRPDLVLVSAGFDAHQRDPLGNMNLSTQAFARMTRFVHALARRHAQGKIAFFLEGGYDLDALASSVRACIDALLEES